jgi:hypothetical protein
MIYKFILITRDTNDPNHPSKRAEYGKQIVATLSQQLVKQYGKVFELRNLRRMLQFAELFPDNKIVSPLATQLSWSHFIELLPLTSHEARLYYANEAATRNLGKRELCNQISRKAYEHREIANAALSEKSKIPLSQRLETPCGCRIKNWQIYPSV